MELTLLVNLMNYWMVLLNCSENTHYVDICKLLHFDIILIEDGRCHFYRFYAKIWLVVMHNTFFKC